MRAKAQPLCKANRSLRWRVAASAAFSGKTAARDISAAACPPAPNVGPPLLRKRRARTKAAGRERGGRQLERAGVLPVSLDTARNPTLRMPSLFHPVHGRELHVP